MFICDIFLKMPVFFRTFLMKETVYLFHFNFEEHFLSGSRIIFAGREWFEKLDSSLFRSWMLGSVECGYTLRSNINDHRKQFKKIFSGHGFVFYEPNLFRGVFAPETWSQIFSCLDLDEMNHSMFWKFDILLMANRIWKQNAPEMSLGYAVAVSWRNNK